MLEQDRPTLDQRWDPAVAADLTAVMDEFPPRSRLYLTIKKGGLWLDPAVLAEADDDDWVRAVRPAALLRMERGQVAEALQLVRGRRAGGWRSLRPWRRRSLRPWHWRSLLPWRGRSLLPDIEIEALERRGRVRPALRLARKEQKWASQRRELQRLRAFTSQEARILERMHKWSAAWDLLDSLAALDRDRRVLADKFDDEVRTRELVVLTSMLRIARNERRPPPRGRVRTIVSRAVRIVWRPKRPDRHIDEFTRETVSLVEATPRRLLTANPSLLRDLAAEIGPSAPEIEQLAASVANTAGDSAQDLSTQFRRAADTSQEYLAVTHSRYPASARDEAYTISYRVIRLTVGFLGISLPLFFIFGEAYLLKGGVHVRGSLSAYYHTSMRDIFVGGLCVIGFLLATYMAGEAKTLDFWASLIAGIAVLGIVFFPTTRPGLPAM
jgi:hypothetical protein